jgi:hypothetical protein
MAHIETWWSCRCGARYGTQKEATSCAISHVRSEQWAVGKGGKAVRISANCAPDGMYGVNWALREADLSDLVEERRRQLAEMEERNAGKGKTHTSPAT